MQTSIIPKLGDSAVRVVSLSPFHRGENQGPEKIRCPRSVKTRTITELFRKLQMRWGVCSHQLSSSALPTLAKCNWLHSPCFITSGSSPSHLGLPLPHTPPPHHPQPVLPESLLSTGNEPFTLRSHGAAAPLVSSLLSVAPSSRGVCAPACPWPGPALPDLPWFLWPQEKAAPLLGVMRAPPPFSRLPSCLSVPCPVLCSHREDRPHPPAGLPWAIGQAWSPHPRAMTAGLCVCPRCAPRSRAWPSLWLAWHGELRERYVSE